MREADSIELRWFLAVIRRWAWLIIGCTLLALILAFGVTSRMSPAYEATTTLLVAPAEGTSTSEINTLMAGERLALTYTQMLRDRVTAQAVIAHLRLDAPPEALIKRVKAEPIPNTQLIRLTVTDASPKQAALLADAFADAFTARMKDMQGERFSGSLRAATDELAAMQSEVAATQSRIADAAARKAGLEAKLARASARMAELRAERQFRQQTLGSLELVQAQLADAVRIAEPARMPVSRSNGPYAATVTLLIDAPLSSDISQSGASTAGGTRVSSYVELLTSATLLQEAMSGVSSSGTLGTIARPPTVKSVPNTQLARLVVEDPEASRAVSYANAIAEALVDKARAQLATPYAERAKNTQEELAQLAAQVEEVQISVDQWTAEKQETEMELAQLQALQAEHRADAHALQQNYEQLRIMSVRAAAIVAIVERAYAPESPARNRSLYVLLASLVGMLVAFGTAIIAEHLDDTLKTSDDVGRVLGLNALGAIGQLDRDQSRLVVVSLPQSAAAEAFRIVATNTRLSTISNPPRTLLVTSPMRGEGKSAVAANLAAALAGMGLQVIALDADLRAPQLHRLFELPGEEGLTEALLLGSAEGYLQHTRIAGLRVLTSGTLPPDPVEVISSRKLVDLLNGLAGLADVVVIDSPPVLAVAETTILSAAVDAVQLVIRAGRTRSEDAKQAVERIRQGHGHLIGVVINDVRGREESYYVPRRPKVTDPGWFRRLRTKLRTATVMQHAKQ